MIISHKVRKYSSVLFVFVFTIVFSATMIAQTQAENDADNRPEADTKTEQSGDKGKEQTAADNKDRNKTPGEIFNPTEEISEDSPVPFPIDI